MNARYRQYLPRGIEIMKARDEFEWVGERTIEEAWAECPRGDWMIMYYAETHPENKRELSLAKGLCANTVRHLMTDSRSLAAVDYAIAYGRGEVEYDPSYADAAYAADADAFDAFDAAAYAAYAEAAYAAADAAEAAYAAYIAAKTKNRLDTANICREVLKL